jgi:transcription initiation factor IIE alpha subunit
VQQTSLEVYANVVKPNLGERQRQVLRVFLLNRRKSFTNHELARELRMEINTVVPRVYELREKGLLVLAGK